MGKTDNVVQLNDTKEEATSKLDTIRNLIFGENIEEYEVEFASLKKDIREKKKVLESLVEEVRQELQSAIDNVATDVNIRITELEDKLDDRIEGLQTDKVDRAALGKMLVTLGEKVGEKQS